MAAGPFARDARPDLARLTAALGEDSLAAAAAAGLALAVRASGASAAALFLLGEGEGEGFDEYWFPAQLDRAGPTAESLRAAARAWSAGEPPADGSAVRAYPLVSGGRPLGEICLAAPDGAGEGWLPAGPDLDAALDLLTGRVRVQREAEHARAELVRYERWFKTLDSHLHTLDRERQKFLAVMNQTDTYVFVVGSTGEVSWTNKSMGAYLEGAARGRMTCREACARFAGTEPGGSCGDCAAERAMKGDGAAHQELRREDGGIFRNFYLTALPIRGPDGKPQEALVMVQDLSDLSVLRESESRYRLLFERSSNALLLLDPGSQRILHANEMACRFLGYSREEFAGLSLADLHTREEWAQSCERYVKLMAVGSHEPIDCVLVAKDGRERWARAHVSRIDLEGREVGLVEFRDLTDRKRIEVALAESERRLATVVDNAPIVLFSTDTAGTFTLCRGMGLAPTGRLPGEAEGQSAHQIYADNPHVVRNIERALEGEAFTDQVAVGPVVFDVQYTPLFDDEGRVTGMIGVALDVTRHQRLEEQLRHVQKMEAIGRLAGGVAHDFNNLLTVILGQSELILMAAPPGSPLRRNAEQVRAAAERGGWLARQLLAFGRKDAPAPAALDLNEVVAAIEPMLRRLIGEDIELRTVTGSSPHHVRADHGHLDQIILNLALNARDAMPNGGRLRVEVVTGDANSTWLEGRDVAHRGPHALLTVSDTGCGMSAETMAHLFEPFFTTKERGKGTGLGLSIVYGIVEQCGGDVWVESEPGRGTKVFVCLPLADADRRSKSGAGEGRDGRPGSEFVLLVEDEDPVRELVRDMLEMAGYRVHAASGGPEALEWAQDPANDFDLLVSDVVMPRMNGGELAERLRHLRGELRVLFVSGYPDDAIVRHGVRESGAPFLQKPFTFQMLTEKVREVLDTSVRRAA